MVNCTVISVKGVGNGKTQICINTDMYKHSHSNVPKYMNVCLQRFKLCEEKYKNICLMFVGPYIIV